MAATTKYIVLEDTIGEELERSWFSTKRTPFELYEGQILECSPASDQPEEPKMIALRVIPTWDNITLECSKLDVGQLTDSEADLLGAVSSREERLSIYRDKHRLSEANTMDIGSKVFVIIRKQNTELELRGVIRSKGNFSFITLEGYYTGTMFGVELLDKESEGCGTSDGTNDYDGKRYFTCPEGRGIFVAVDQLRPRQDQDQDQGVGEWLWTTFFGKGSSEQVLGERGLRTSCRAPSLETKENICQKSDGRLAELATSLDEERKIREEVERRLHSSEHELELSLRRFRSSEKRSNELETSLASERQAHQETERRLRSKEQRLNQSETSLSAERQAHQETESRLRSSEERLHELQGTLTTVRQAYEDYRRSIESTRDWVVRRDEIRLSDKVIGVGAWGEVKEGTFRGCKVAVKKIHHLILSDHNRRLFEREMNMASRCRHPCLLQFIGATNDDQSPLFVTELLDTSLRSVLQDDRPLNTPEITTIALDVAKALNYLHLSHPSIIHRDISSANVLLWKHVTLWRAKVSDYGTANFLQHTMTACPGAVIYSAPEAQTSRQSPKLDVYSFGVLLCEMNVRQMPDPDHRNEQVAMVNITLFRNLIRRCLQQNREERPSMTEIIETLENSPQ